MDVQLPDGTTVKGVPDGTTKAQLATKLRANGRTVPDDWLKSAAPSGSPPEPPEIPTVEGAQLGMAETGAAMGTGAVGAGVGNIVAAVREIAARTLGADQQTGRLEGQEAGGKVAEALQYQPRTAQGKEYTRTVGELMKDSKLEGLNPAMPIGELSGSLAKGAGRRTIKEHLQGEGLVPKPVEAPPAPAMAGVGAAETDVARMRRERAASLDVPLKLSKGQATRDFEQQRFEREAAKSPKLGQPLREHFAEQNEQILQNFDTWVEKTGAEAPTLRATGQVVDEALVTKAKRAKASINAAYEKARASGEMEAPVSTAGVAAYLEENASAEGVAKVLPAARAELARLEKIGGKPGRISINDMERLRQFIGEAATMGSPDMVHAPKLKAAIDAATESASGSLYKAARKLRKAYAEEFEDHAVVAKLLDTKPGTKDRAVAYEDVFAKTMLDGSLDDVRHLRKVLQTEGTKGEQAWKELQGQTISYIREQATKGVSTDIRGNAIVSPAALNKIVKSLDADDKLEFIFGKQGAQQIRDINDLAKDVFTAPPGAVNQSVTASVLLDALSDVASVGGHGSTVKGIAWVRDKFKGLKVKRRIKDALGDPTALGKTVRELQEAE